MLYLAPAMLASWLASYSSAASGVDIFFRLNHLKIVILSQLPTVEEGAHPFEVFVTVIVSGTG